MTQGRFQNHGTINKILGGATTRNLGKSDRDLDQNEVWKHWAPLMQGCDTETGPTMLRGH
jgi:hypothetical protein